MLKIKLNLFESIVVSISISAFGFSLTTVCFIIALIVKQKMIVYKALATCYFLCLTFLVISVFISFLVNSKSKKEFIMYGDEFEFLHKKHLTKQICRCIYYKCRWYELPIALIFKNQRAGLIDIRLENGKKIQFKLLYADYLKLKKYIPNIVER